MGLLRASNPWGKTGGTLNMQRSDLWVVNMASVYDLIVAHQIPYGLPTADYLPAREDLQYFVRSVQFPDPTINAETMYRGGTPLPYPGYDNVCPSIRIMFAMETGDEWGHSRMYDMMEAWRMLVRAGREGFAGEYAITLPQKTGYQVEYRADLPIYLLSAPVDGAPAGKGRLSDEEMAKYLDSKNNHDFSISAAFNARGAWLSGLQPSEIQYEQGGLMTFAATIYADHILGGYGIASMGATDFPQDKASQISYVAEPPSTKALAPAVNTTKENQTSSSSTQPPANTGKLFLSQKSTQMVTPGFSITVPGGLPAKTGPVDNSPY